MILEAEEERPLLELFLLLIYIYISIFLDKILGKAGLSLPRLLFP